MDKLRPSSGKRASCPQAGVGPGQVSGPGVWHVRPTLPDGRSAYLHVQVLLSVRDVQNETRFWVRHLGRCLPPRMPLRASQQEVQGGGSVPLLLLLLAPRPGWQPPLSHPEGQRVGAVPPSPGRATFPRSPGCLPALTGRERFISASGGAWTWGGGQSLPIPVAAIGNPKGRVTWVENLWSRGITTPPWGWGR